MRFLHTSDWHIGRSIRGKPRWSEQERCLQQVLTHAREQNIDCLLVSGDVFDTSTPSPDAEELVYSFFRELHAVSIPAVVIAGNHDHPVRFDALSHLMSALRVHIIGEPVGPESGGQIRLQSRDGSEEAVITSLPWVLERKVLFSALQEGEGAPIAQYSERVAEAMRRLTHGYRPDTCNIMLAHLFMQNAVIGPGGGERELTLSMGIYGVNPQMLPMEPQYIALGHVHKAQAVRKSPAVHYSGSLLQLDFGEREQGKSVNLVEVHPRRPAEVTQLPITAGKGLYDLGSPARGIALNDLAMYREKYPEEAAWLRVFVEVDTPIANLPAFVRAELPNAVHIERANVHSGANADAPSTAGLGPIEMFDAFYRSDLGRGRDPAKGTVELFRRLLEEETSAAAEA